MVNHHIAIALYKDAIALFCAASLTISSPVQTKPAAPLEFAPSVSAAATACKYLNERDTGIYMKTRLWRYLRKGINYLEASGKEVPTYFMHSGARAYGPLALTPIAIKDVKRHYPNLSGIALEDVLLDKDLYDMFAFYYADLLLKHYLKLDYFKMNKEDVFSALERAWFLGPALYIKGHPVTASRELRANEYLSGKS